MKVYVASSWRNERQPDVVKALRSAGHEVYDFRHPHMGPGARGEGFQWAAIDQDWQHWTPAQFREALENQQAIDGCACDLAGKVADELEALLPAIEKLDDGDAEGGFRMKREADGSITTERTPGHLARVGGYAGATRRFIAGCRAAAAAGEPLEFY